MAADGKLLFETGIDNSGFVAGVTQMTTAATAAAATITTGLSAAAIKVGSDFEASMSQVGATMGITSASEDFAMLSAAAKEMGESTKYSAAQASSALNFLALSGKSAEESVAALPTVLNVAAAGGMELASASDMITDAMSALGLETSQMSTFADQLAVTSQKSNTSVSQLGEAILTVGGTAKTLSGGVVEINTALGILADNGIKGSEGGTMLRNVILSLSAPTSTAAAELSKLGVSAFDSNGQMKPLQETFANLGGALFQLTEQERTEALSNIFNKVDLKGVNALLGTSAERFDELSGYISDCSGAAAQMAATMDDNLKGDLTIMQSALEGLGIAAYEKFQEPMRTAVQEVTNSIGDLSSSLNDGELSESMDKVAEGFGSIVSSATQLLANDVLPALINSFAWVVENADDLKTVLVAVGSAMVIYETATGAAAAANIIHTASVSGMSVALKEYTATSWGASVAAGVLAKANAAMSAAMLVSPVAALAAVIGGIYVAAVASAVSRQKELNAAAAQGSEVYAEQQQAIQELADAYEDVNKKSEEMISSREDEISTLNALKSKLADNVDENGKITGSYETVKAVVEEINKIYPEQIELINGQIQGYNGLATSIDGYIENLRKSTLIEAKREVYKTAIVTYDETSTAYDGLYENALAATEAYEKAQAAYNKFNAPGSVNNFTAETKRNADEMGKSVSEYLTDQLNYTQGVRESAWQAYSENKKLMDKSAQDMSDYENMLTQNSVSGTETYWEYMQRVGKEKAEEYVESSRKEAETAAEAQAENTALLKSAWEQAEHEYATGVISSEEDLYARKSALLSQYGNADLKEHWKYYEELYGYQQDYSEKSQKEAKEAAEAAKKAAEDAAAKELAERQSEWENIDRLNTLGLMSDEDAIKARADFVKKYYGDVDITTGKGITDENYQYVKKVHEDDITATKEALDKQEKLVDDGLSAIVKRYQKAYDELEQKRKNYRDKLMAVGGDLFSVEEIEKPDGTKVKQYTVNDINEQLRKMREYNAAVKKLRAQGMSDEMFAQMTSLGAEDSAQFAKYLSGMSAAEFAKINAAYEEKQKLADELASDLYKNDAQLISDSYTDALAGLASSAYEYGAQSALEFAKGFKESMQELDAGGLYSQLEAAGAARKYENYKTVQDTKLNAVFEILPGKTVLTMAGKVVGEAVTDFQLKQQRITSS